MAERLEKHRKFIFLGIIIIALGITLSTTLSNTGFGTVLLAVGGLFFIIGMKQKRDYDKLNNDKP